jgi:cellulose biosynthesis protein BcsQ
MALVMLHAPRGGAGTTVLAANLAIGLAQAGRPVAVLDFCARSTLGMHFGLPLDAPIPAFDGPTRDRESAHGVTLLRMHEMAERGDLFEGLAAGHFGFEGDTLYIADMGAADPAVCEQLRAYAAFDLCVLTPSAEALAALPIVLEHSGPDSFFALNKVDDTRRFGRHAASLLRELLGDQLIASIRSDEAVVEAAAMLQPLARHAPASAALHDINALGVVLADLAHARQVKAPVTEAIFPDARSNVA